MKPNTGAPEDQALVLSPPVTERAGAPFPENESERLEALLRHGVLDTDPEKHFDDLALLAAHICKTPIALVSLVDKERQWFKAQVGLAVKETPRNESFCAHAILQSDLFVVQDAANDSRFLDNPLVTGEPKIRFYAGMPLLSANGKHALGTLCIIDRVPRQLSVPQRKALEALGRQAEALLEMRTLLHKEQELARIDSLTGAANRRSFYEKLEEELSRLRRHQRPFSIAYVDLDNLKKVNDKFGHEQGDSVLSTVSSTIRQSIRRADTIARLGGDEFAVLFSETGTEGARVAMDLLNGRLLDAMRLQGWPVTFSIGLLTCLEAQVSAEELVKKADDLMYLVKSSGKNAITHSTIPSQALFTD